MRAWDDFDIFEPIIDKYMPTWGEGETMASQIATAINKLVYKWYNDGDVFDNTYNLPGWCNDLSSFANWLYKYVEPTREILESIADCEGEDDYAELLYDLCDRILGSGYIDRFASTPKLGSVYEELGRFIFKEHYDEEDY